MITRDVICGHDGDNNTRQHIKDIKYCKVQFYNHKYRIHILQIITIIELCTRLVKKKVIDDICIDTIAQKLTTVIFLLPLCGAFCLILKRDSLWNSVPTGNFSCYLPFYLHDIPLSFPLQKPFAYFLCIAVSSDLPACNLVS